MTKFFLGIFFFYKICFSQITLSISEYHPFSEKINILDLNPTIINWSIDNSFLLIDNLRKEFFKQDKFGNVNRSSFSNHNSNSYSDLIWIGVSPYGINVLDRLENKILYFDHNLNPISEIKMDKSLFPEFAAIDSWGILYLYSRAHNAIYIFENNQLNKFPFIDLNLVFSNSFCIKEISINQDSELGILDCNGTVHLFNRNGRKKISINSTIKKSKFLVSIRNDWLIFDEQGNGVSINNQKKIVLPGSSIPIIDIASMNRSLAILSRDHILIMNVK